MARSVLIFLFFGFFDITWDSLDNEINDAYPEVRSISTEQLYTHYRENDVSLPVIIDVRETREYEVSHLPGARNIKTAKLISRLYPDKNTNIVLYCSVGYRSAIVSSDLGKMGYENVRNLKHSIFEWANKDYPLVNKQGETNFAHPYDKKWGVLLKETLHQY